MRLHTLFRFSGYLCLTLSTASLGLAEGAQIEGSAIFYVAIGLVLLAEYLTADRWLMPQGVANIVAIAILVGWVLWFIMGLDFGGDDQLGQLLPRAGPMLGVLLVAKLMRPKETSDYWMLHLLGLVQVMLACVLALQSRLDRENPIFPALLVAYALSLVWAMVLFYLYREAESVRGTVPGAKPPEAAPATGVLTLRSPWRTLGAASALSWFVMGVMLGLGVFFAIPRPGQDSAASLLIPSGVKPQVGFSPGLDLNETSPLEVSEEEVMRVEAFDAAGRRVSLDSDQQRWRGVACTIYQRGKWIPARTSEQQVLQMVLPDELGSRQLKLSFGVDLSKLQSGWHLSDDDRSLQLSDLPGHQPLFLAEPVTTQRALPRVALANRSEQGQTLLSYRPRELTLGAPNARRSRRLFYDQVFDTPEEQGLPWGDALPFKLQESASRAYWDLLLKVQVGAAEADAFAAKAREILTKAGIDPRPLTEGTLAGVKKQQLRIAVARALESHLAASPEEYGYTLDRPRRDLAIDPTLDFLCNTKQGHCGLYASALTMMLRSQGIPARVIIGFRGARWNSFGEYHSVCQYHAHAWVEAFIEDANNAPIPPRNQPAAATGARQVPEFSLTAGRWLTLDATPAGGTAGIAGAGSPGLIDDQINFLRYLWEFFILDYSGDLQRERLMNKLNTTFNLQEIKSFWETLADLFQRGGMLPYLVLLAAITIFVAIPLAIRSAWRWRRAVRLARQSASVAFYTRFLRLMERLRLRPLPSQTPAEFADQAANVLQTSRANGDGASIPPEVAAEFYHIRYGGRPLEDEAKARTDALVDRLETVLKK